MKKKSDQIKPLHRKSLIIVISVWAVHLCGLAENLFQEPPPKYPATIAGHQQTNWALCVTRISVSQWTIHRCMYSNIYIYGTISFFMEINKPIDIYCFSKRFRVKNQVTFCSCIELKLDWRQHSNYLPEVYRSFKWSSSLFHIAITKALVNGNNYFSYFLQAVSISV